MKLSDFDYKLEKSFIAQHPVEPKDHSKLMVVKNNKIEHKQFYNIIDYLKKGDVLVINETKVLSNRIIGNKTTGGKAELIINKKLKNNICECLIKTRKPKTGAEFIFKNKIKGKIINKKGNLFIVQFNKNINKIIERIGELPTPPYVKSKIKKDTEYQTVYSSVKGSLAAPTAGLHFTKNLLKKLKNKGVKIAKLTLHISFSTFSHIREEDFTKHKMDPEYFSISKKNAETINKRRGRLFVVGTTSLKALESLNKNKKITAKSGYSNLFIYPGYAFKNKVDGFITNFHLPKSSLLLLTCAFYGRKNMLNAYEEAIKHNYRFFSFGDAMLLLKENSHPQ
ncbi:MAG: tRNA preQ1(34) S-adenosylmethionine ribosyltransferase-isomerase QueA [Candidatus Woesearchaeota archaeon]|nr:tRNA preQ1(34) S-adenosylmethionine ribosyltransferase-isomerase QueA [Candidatus Woesearchaeota archaeon]